MKKAKVKNVEIREFPARVMSRNKSLDYVLTSDQTTWSFEARPTKIGAPVLAELLPVKANIAASTFTFAKDENFVVVEVDDIKFGQLFEEFRARVSNAPHQQSNPETTLEKSASGSVSSFLVESEKIVSPSQVQAIQRVQAQPMIVPLIDTPGRGIELPSSSFAILISLVRDMKVFAYLD